ncbi:MAG: ABC-F family ATP-binding cassette domain-containing protein, partial [Opitutae bacterium]|nr:ABC-F family ATP-binding cassette domain-containing protein [Opitutae bacterium]
PNGAGKSTLLKILGNIIPIEAGTRELGLNVSVGYFSQQRVDILDMECSVLDEATDGIESSITEQKARGILGAFLFRGDDVFKKVRVLSGGEKSRLALVKLLLDPPNLLLLDEPTTHLDMPSIDAFIEALKSYTGTIVFVSHDVHFIRAIAKNTIQIEAGKVTPYAGDYDYYLRKSEASSEQGGLVAGLRNASPQSESGTKEKTRGISPKERRRRNAEKRKAVSLKRKSIEMCVAKLESEILALEEEQALISKQLEDPNSYADKEKAKELSTQADRVARRLNERNYEWEIETENLLNLEQEN